MNEYHKINTIFKRDRTTNRIIEGDYSCPEFEFLANNVWTWSEKVDGTNIRVMLQGGNVTFGGRTDSAQIPAQLVTRLNERFLSLTEKMQELFSCDVCLYGEGYGAKIQKGGGNYRQDQDFVLFDILVSNVEYDTIKSCPKHHELINATLSDLTSLKGFVNPAITSTLRNKILNGRQTSSGDLLNTLQRNAEAKTVNCLPESAISKQNLDSLQKSSERCCQNKTECAQSAGKETLEMGAEEESCRSRSITATIPERLEVCSATPAIQRFIKQNETPHGSTPQECTCKINDWWLQRADVEDVARKLSLDVVPIIGEGTLHNAVVAAKYGIVSTWGEFQAEGIVARPKTELKTRTGHRIITKIKCRDFGA